MTNNVNFKCEYYADGRPVTVEDGPYYHVLTKRIDIDFTADAIRENFSAMKGAKLILTHCRRNDEWQLVAKHPSDGLRANKRNRAIARVTPGSAIDRLLREHTRRHTDGYTQDHTPHWGVSGFDTETGTIHAWLTDEAKSGLPYETIRAAELVLEEQGINA